MLLLWAPKNATDRDRHDTAVHLLRGGVLVGRRPLVVIVQVGT